MTILLGILLCESVVILAQLLDESSLNDGSCVIEGLLTENATHGNDSFEINCYHNYTEIANWLLLLQDDYPALVSVESIGQTYEMRDIWMIKISNSHVGQTTAKPAIVVDGGIHGREWIAPASVIYFIHTSAHTYIVMSAGRGNVQLVTEYSNKADIRQLVDSMDWYIVPIVNPDGYEYSRSDQHEYAFMWRKNRNPNTHCQPTNTSRCCEGVDLNRNFDYNWGKGTSSTHTCSSIYRGRGKNSEAEAQAVIGLLSAHADAIKCYITVHAHGRLIIVPYGMQQQSKFKNLVLLANETAETITAVRDRQTTPFGSPPTYWQAGTVLQTLGYTNGGSSRDWAKGKARIDYCFTFEVGIERQPDEEEIILDAIDAWTGVRHIAQRMIQLYA